MKRYLLFFMLLYLSRALYCQVIITEIMADPVPSVGLPEVEYLEIRNVGEQEVDLSGWQLSDGKVAGMIDHMILLPDTSLILSSESNAMVLGEYGMVAGLRSWPALNNSGDLLILSDASGKTMDSVVYDISMYGSSSRSQGGWALERIDLKGGCHLMTNWTASINGQGGTPGRMNSVNTTKFDLKGPYLISAYSPDRMSVILVFNEPVDSRYVKRSFIEVAHHEISGLHFGRTQDTVILELQTDLNPDNSYRVVVHNIRDCTGNLAGSEAGVIFPVTTGTDLIRVNEVLFDPYPGHDDFIELINQSSSVVLLNNIRMSYFSPENIQEEKEKLVIPGKILLTPGEILLVAKDPRQSISYYASEGNPRYVELNLFNIPNSGGTIRVMADGDIHDSIFLSPDFHHEMVKETEGYSLERVDPAANGWLESSWASSSRIATPGNPNAQHIGEIGESDILKLSDEVFYPLDAESLQILLELPVTGVLGTVRIYSLDGQLIRTLCQNKLLDTRQHIQWTGISDQGAMAIPGYYIIHCQLYGQNGFRKNLRQRVLIGMARDLR